MKQAACSVDGRILRSETHVAAPPWQVEAYVADLQHMERWWPEHWRYRRLSGDGGAGTRYYWIVRGPGYALPGITHIEARGPGQLAYRTAMAGLPIRVRYQFLADPQGTRVCVEMESPGLRLGLFARAVGEQLGQALGRLSETGAAA